MVPWNSAEQERRDGRPGHQARRTGADGGRRELCGHDRPGQRVRHAGQGAARGSRAPHEAANATALVDRGIQTLKKDLATRVARKGGQWSDHFERAAGAYNARPHEVYGAAGHRVPAAAGQRRQVPAQQGPHGPAHEGGGGRGRLPSADERGEEPSVRRRAAAAQRGGPGDPAEAGAAGAAGQRQRGGPADETGQAGGCEAAGRLPGASEAQDFRLAFC